MISAAKLYKTIAFVIFLLFSSFVVGRPIIIKLQSAYPKNIAHLGSVPYELSRLVAKMSRGKIKIKVYQPDQIIDTLELESAVGAGKLDAALGGLGYKTEEVPALELFSAIPFGLAPLGYSGWMYNGGGLKMLRGFLAPENVVPLPAVLLPAEGAGWYKKEIISPHDLAGLKIRAYGLARSIFKKLGAKPVIIAGHKLYQQLKSGKLDAAEFSSPSIDLDLKLYQVAKYYYFPGWHQPGTFLFFFFNRKMWQKLPAYARTIIETASRSIVFSNYTKLEVDQLAALQKLRSKTKIRTWSPKMLGAFYDAWLEIVKKYQKTDPRFRKVWQSLQRYRKQYNYWQSLNQIKLQ